MTKRILTLLAAIGGLTVLVVAFVALYSLRGQSLGDPTRAESPITGAQPAPANVEAQAGESGESGEAGEPAEHIFAEAGGSFTAVAGARLDLVDEPGVVVSALVKDSAAAKAGVKRGDIVLAVDDQKIDDMRALTRALAEKKAGDSVSLAVKHGDAERKLSVTLDDQAGHGFLGIVPCGPGAGMARAVRLAGPAMRGGAFVESVVAEGPAAKAGLKETDMITAVDGKPIDPDNDLASLIAAHKPGDTVVLAVQRREESSTGADDEDDAAVKTFEIKIEPVELKVVLGESPDKAGTAYLGLRYHAGGPFMWHEAMPGMPAVPSMPGEPMVAPLPPLPEGAAPPAGDVLFFSDEPDTEGEPGAEGAAPSDTAFTISRALPVGDGEAKFKLKFKAGHDAEIQAAGPSKDI